MIKIASSFKSKKIIVFIIGLLCILGIGSRFLISDKTKGESALKSKDAITNGYKASITSLDSKVLVSSELENSKTIDEAVSGAIMERASSYKQGEVATEGHIILYSEEKGEIVKVYAIASYGAFGFENGIFTFVSGSGAIPTVITFTKNENKEYTLKEYKEPMDGSEYTKSIKKMFPKNLWYKVFNSSDFPEIRKQQEGQAGKYLESIGRKAKVSSENVEKTLPNINVEASNKLFSEYTKFDSELNRFPYWLGTLEEVQNGVRYIYETSKGKTDDGYDLMIFTKKKEDGTVVKEHKYKIVGTEPKLIE